MKAAILKRMPKRKPRFACEGVDAAEEAEVVEVAESVEEAEAAGATGEVGVVEGADAPDESEEVEAPEVSGGFEEYVGSEVISSATTIPPLPMHSITRTKQVEIAQTYLLKNEGEDEERGRKDNSFLRISKHIIATREIEGVTDATANDKNHFRHNPDIPPIVNGLRKINEPNARKIAFSMRSISSCVNIPSFRRLQSKGFESFSHLFSHFDSLQLKVKGFEDLRSS